MTTAHKPAAGPFQVPPAFVHKGRKASTKGEKGKSKKACKNPASFPFKRPRQGRSESGISFAGDAAHPLKRGFQA